MAFVVKCQIYIQIFPSKWQRWELRNVSQLLWWLTLVRALRWDFPSSKGFGWCGEWYWDRLPIKTDYQAVSWILEFTSGFNWPENGKMRQMGPGAVICISKIWVFEIRFRVFHQKNRQSLWNDVLPKFKQSFPTWKGCLINLARPDTRCSWQYKRKIYIFRFFRRNDT